MTVVLILQATVNLFYQTTLNSDLQTTLNFIQKIVLLFNVHFGTNEVETDTYQPGLNTLIFFQQNHTPIHGSSVVSLIRKIIECVIKLNAKRGFNY